MTTIDEQDLVYRLRKRAEIRRQIKGRKSVEEGKPDRICLLLEEAATEISNLQAVVEQMKENAQGYQARITALTTDLTFARRQVPYDDDPMIKMFRDD